MARATTVGALKRYDRDREARVWMGARIVERLTCHTRCTCLPLWLIGRLIGVAIYAAIQEEDGTLSDPRMTSLHQPTPSYSHVRSSPPARIVRWFIPAPYSFWYP
jgi:hypothetical protein